MNTLRRLVTCASLLAALGPIAATPRASAQKVAAVPQLDLKKLSGIWFEQAHLPDKWERRCVADGAVLFALSDKPHSFQLGTFCRVAGGNLDSRNDSGKLDKSGDGILKVRHLVIFSTKLHVLALGPDYAWALLGTPNHKTLTLISRKVTLEPETIAQLQAIAVAQGFKIDKIVRVSHPGGFYHPNDQADHTSSPASTTAPATLPTGAKTLPAGPTPSAATSTQPK